MKFNIELNVYELNHLMTTGTFQALCSDVQAAEGEAKKTPKAAFETKAVAAVETEKKTPAVTNTETAADEKADVEISEVEIRAKFVELSKKGKKTELKELLTAMGVEKVSDLKPDQYPEAMAKLEAI